MGIGGEMLIGGGARGGEIGSDAIGARLRLQVGPLSVDFARFVVSVKDEPVALTRMEFELLAYLMRNADRVVSQKELVEEVIGGIYSADSSVVRVHVAHLRQKLGVAAGVISTSRGRGFLFDPEFT